MFPQPGKVKMRVCQVLLPIKVDEVGGIIGGFGAKLAEPGLNPFLWVHPLVQ